MFIDVFRFALRQGRLRPAHRHLLWEKSREGGRKAGKVQDNSEYFDQETMLVVRMEKN